MFFHTRNQELTLGPSPPQQTHALIVNIQRSLPLGGRIPTFGVAVLQFLDADPIIVDVLHHVVHMQRFPESLDVLLVLERFVARLDRVLDGVLLAELARDFEHVAAVRVAVFACGFRVARQVRGEEGGEGFRDSCWMRLVHRREEIRCG